jgi:DNA-binding IclR family transcriptional regulator
VPLGGRGISILGTSHAQHRALSILEILQDGEPRPLSRLAARTGLPKSTVLRFLRSLEQRGWVQRNGDQYALGAAVVAVAHRYLTGASPAVAAAPAMQALRDRIGETVSLSAISGAVRVCIQEFPSSHELRHVHNIGSVGPLHAGASGRVLLAHLSEEERARLLTGRLPRFTPRTITDQARVARECALVRRRGYAMSRGEKTPGSVAIAVPLQTPGSNTTYALAIFAPEVRFRAQDRAIWVRALRECAASVGSGRPSSTRGASVA